MVAGLAFIATAVATVFAQATAVRWSRSRAPHQAAWTVALALFALASAAFATGSSTGWDEGTFRIFYLLGAIVNVPWLALGTVYLLWGRRIGNPVRAGLVFFSGLATGVMLSTPIHGTIPTDTLPIGSEHLDALPRARSRGSAAASARSCSSAARCGRRGGSRACARPAADGSRSATC